MASETVDTINWAHPHPHGKRGLQIARLAAPTAGLEHASTGMPDQRTACAATQGLTLKILK